MQENLSGEAMQLTQQKQARRQLEEALTLSNQRLNFVLASSSASLWEWHKDTADMAILLEQIESDQGSVPINEWQQLQDTIKGLWHGDTDFLDITCRVLEKAGAVRWICLRGQVLERCEHGVPVRMIGTRCDMTSRFENTTLRHDVAALREEQQRIHTTLDALQAGTWEWDLNADTLNFNEQWSLMLDYAPRELESLSRSVWESQIHRDDLPLVRSAMERHLAGKSERIEVEYRVRKSKGEWIWLRSTGCMVETSRGQPTNIMAGLTLEITELKAQQQRVEYVELHDTLTDLPNRNLFTQLLKAEMSNARRKGHLLALVYLDIDGFAQINDQHGPETGDRVIIALSHRIRNTIREHHNIARIGGDEFLVLLTGLEQPGDCHPPLRRLRESLSDTLVVDGLKLQTSSSLGVTLYPQSLDVDADGLLRQVSQSLYQAKQAGKNRYIVFDSEHDTLTRLTLEKIEEIRLALVNDEFELFYQPKVNLMTGQVIGAEALIRWQHPQHGLLPPALFIPLIEQHELALALGDWVIQTALKQITLWQQRGLSSDFCVSVNVPAIQLLDDGFAERVFGFLAAHPDVRPAQLELEILETSAIEDMKTTSELITTFQSAGINCALDDFGTGYSSLTFLKNIPAGTIKIDQSFIYNMLADTGHLIIIKSILGLAQSFGRQVIAEGIELPLHGSLLLELGCTLGQGYSIARPMPADQFLPWASQWQPPQEWRDVKPISTRMVPLLMAEAEHRQWLQQLEAYLSNDLDLPPAQGGAASRFESWLTDTTTLSPSVRMELETRHRAVHRQAELLVSLFDSGCSDVFPGRLASLQQTSTELIALLRQSRAAAPAS